MSRPGSFDRQALRKQRQLEAEKEQLKEDAEALGMTEVSGWFIPSCGALTRPQDQRKTLLGSFEEVKTQFFDLDGLNWTPSALRKRAHTVSVGALPTSLPALSYRYQEFKKPAAPVEEPPLSPLTNTLSKSDSWEDTIRPGDNIRTLLASYHAADKNDSTVSRAGSSRYISYPRARSLEASSPSSEHPTPRPTTRVSDTTVPPTPTPAPSSLKRRRSPNESSARTTDAKRAHTSPLGQRIPV